MDADRVGRAGDLVLNTPRSGLVGSPPGWVTKTLRRAWCSEVTTMMKDSDLDISRSPELMRAGPALRHSLVAAAMQRG